MVDKMDGVTVTQNPLYKGDLTQPNADADENKAGKAGKSTKVHYTDNLVLPEKTRKKLHKYQKTFGKELDAALLKTKVNITNALSRAGDSFRLLGAHIKDKLTGSDNVLSNAYGSFVKTPTKSEVISHFREASAAVESNVSKEHVARSEANIQDAEHAFEFIPMHQLREILTRTMTDLMPANEEISAAMKKDIAKRNLGELEAARRALR